ncbi:MAG: homocysteine S-methyltransferase [Bacteroidota bacterium]
MSTKIFDTDYPIVLDGGLSNVLEADGCELDHKLWTANLIRYRPEAIVQAHLAYITAGADCIITSSYQASLPGLQDQGYSAKAAKGLLVESVRLAEMAIELALNSGMTEKKPLVAASIGPYGAYLADGSEYRGNYKVSDQLLYDFHLDRIHILDGTKADILACETIPSLQEAKVLSEILKNAQTPAWISFSCKDGEHLNDGSKIEEALSIFKDQHRVFAIGVNCTHPSYISEIIGRIKQAQLGKKIVIYPNSGECYHPSDKAWKETNPRVSFLEMACEWLDLGVDIIGGCCRVGPQEISALKNFLVQRRQANN